VRFRPVLMTALAMIIGMAPMALGLGEGGEQNARSGARSLAAWRSQPWPRCSSFPLSSVWYTVSTVAMSRRPLSSEHLMSPEPVVHPFLAADCVCRPAGRRRRRCRRRLGHRCTGSERQPPAPVDRGAGAARRDGHAAAARQQLAVPGATRRLEAYSRAPIYARVNGYLKSWKVDIGASVQADSCSPKSKRRTSINNWPRPGGPPDRAGQRGAREHHRQALAAVVKTMRSLFRTST